MKAGLCCRTHGKVLTDLIETMKLENRISQSAQCSKSDKDRHEVHGAGPVQADAGRKLNPQTQEGTSRVEAAVRNHHAVNETFIENGQW